MIWRDFMTHVPEDTMNYCKCYMDKAKRHAFVIRRRKPETAFQNEYELCGVISSNVEATNQNKSLTDEVFTDFLSSISGKPEQLTSVEDWNVALEYTEQVGCFECPWFTLCAIMDAEEPIFPAEK